VTYRFWLARLERLGCVCLAGIEVGLARVG
jgi:hypothetical protein